MVSGARAHGGKSAGSNNGPARTPEIVDLDLESLVPSREKGLFYAKNGLVLRLKRVSRLVIVEAGRKIPVPRPPTMYIEEKGREEENPDDPDYILELNAANYERGMLVTTAMLSLGTEIATLPESMERPESDDWLEIMDTLQIAVPRGNRRLRYCAWLKYIALDDDESFNSLLQEVLRYSGLLNEGDVADAAQSFRGQEAGDTDTSVRTIPQVQSGNIN